MNNEVSLDLSIKSERWKTALINTKSIYMQSSPSGRLKSMNDRRNNKANTTKSK